MTSRWIRLAALLVVFVAGGALAWLVVDADSSDGPATASASTAALSTSTTIAVVSSTTSTTTSTTTTTTTTLPPPRTAVLAFTGDLLPHRPVINAADALSADGMDFRPLFEEVEPIISGADLAICHMETPISLDNSHLSSFPVFNGPRAYAEGAEAVGYDGCSTASNHSYDQREKGIAATLQVFDEVGLTAAGMALSPEADLEPVLYEVNGITIAHISATYGLNGFKLPASKQYLVDMIDPAKIIEEARLAREAGAEFVIVSLHWGTQYRSKPNFQQDEWLQEILPSDEIDLIIGSHAHVVQPIDKVGDKWVVFGLGNFLSNQSAACCQTTTTQDGMIVLVRLLEADDGSIAASSLSYVPTWVDRGRGYVIRLADPAEPRDDLPKATLDELQRSAERTEKVVSSRLGPSDGLFVVNDVTWRNPPVRPAVGE